MKSEDTVDLSAAEIPIVKQPVGDAPEPVDGEADEKEFGDEVLEEEGGDAPSVNPPDPSIGEASVEASGNS